MYTTCRNFVYQKNVIDYIYPRIMTEVNVSATVGMFVIVGEMTVTVGEMSATVEECPQQWGKCLQQWGN